MPRIASIQAGARNETDPLLPVPPIQALPVKGVEKGTSKNEEMFGHMLMLFAAVSFAILSVFTHIAATTFHIPPMTIVLLRSTFILTGAGVYMFVFMKPLEEFQSLTREQWTLLFVRGFFGALHVSFFFKSISLIPLGDATSIHFISPMLSTVLAHIVLGEAITPLHVVACVASIFGALLVARSQPSVTIMKENVSECDRVLGCSMAVGSALTEAVASVAVRKAAASVPAMLSVSSEGVFGITVSVLGRGYLSPRDMWTRRTGIATAFACGPFAFAGQVGRTMGLKYVDVGRAMIMLNLHVPIVYLVDFFLGEHPSWQSLVGSGLIIGASVLVAMQQMGP